MRTLPILFNTPMVRLILGGRKTQTRRVVKPVHLQVLDSPFHCKDPEVPDAALLEKLCEPAYQPGDVLYVRETWGIWSPTLGTMPKIYYRADAKADAPEGIIWKPSIHMPKEAARIFLRVTDVGAERLQDITDDGVLAEGLKIGDPFDELWDSTIKPAHRDRYGWDANPWVWVYTFERCGKPEGWA